MLCQMWYIMPFTLMCGISMHCLGCTSFLRRGTHKCPLHRTHAADERVRNDLNVKSVRSATTYHIKMWYLQT